MSFLRILLFSFIGLFFLASFGYASEVDISISPTSAKKGQRIDIEVAIRDFPNIDEVLLEVHKGKEKILEESKQIFKESIALVWHYRPYEAGVYGHCIYLKAENEENPIFFQCASIDVCEDQCYQEGLVECYDNIHKRDCGYYFKEQSPCLKWSSLESCLGNESCGYGECLFNKKSQWFCHKGECDYRCISDSICGSVCDDECFSGESRCVDNDYIQNCGDYKEGCFKWSVPELCAGANSCGYGSCFEDERPQWHCSGGQCLYNCVKDLNCTSSGTDECSFQGETQCHGDYRQICDYYYDSDPALEWSSPESCTGNSSCGYEECSSNKRPSWYCLEGECLYTCVEDLSCEVSAPPFFPDEDDIVTEKDSEIIISILGRKESESSEDWKEEIGLKPEEKIEILLKIKNNSQDNLENSVVRVQFPKDVILKQGLLIDDFSSNKDIKQGINIESFSSGSEKEITFRVEIDKKAGKQNEAEIISNLKTEDMSVSDSLKINILDKPKKGIKWFLSKCFFWIKYVF